MTCRCSRAAVALLLLLAVGCTIKREFNGETLSPERLETLVDARTKADVLEMFGPPQDIGLQLDGSVFIYRCRWEAQENLNLAFFRASFDYETTDRRTDRLVVFFDKQGNKTGQGLDMASTNGD